MGSAQIILNLLNGERRPIHGAHCLHQLPRPSAHALIAEQTVQNIAHAAAAHIILRETQGVTVAHALLNIPALPACIAIPAGTPARHAVCTVPHRRGLSRHHMTGERCAGTGPGEMDTAAQQVEVSESCTPPPTSTSTGAADNRCSTCTKILRSRMSPFPRKSVVAPRSRTPCGSSPGAR